MRILGFVFFVCMLALPVFGQAPRLLITTDIGGDPDDQQSLVRLMVYSGEFEIEGLISSASGVPGELKQAVIRPYLIEEIIHGYQMVYPNLLKHDPNYPEPGYLLSVVKKGNPLRGWAYVGNGHNTEGSDWIIKMVDKKDKQPLNICIFGGQTDLAQALWNVKNYRSQKEYAQFIAKIRIYDINDQDHIFGNIFKEHPSLFYVLAKAPDGKDKREGAYRGIYLGGDESLTSMAWIGQNVLENHGPLGKLYPIKTWTAPNPHGVMKEGDTPSWFFFLVNGLNVADHPEYGGWGGRFLKSGPGYYNDAVDSLPNVKSARATVFRWRNDFQRDWSARMDWCVGEYSKCNHPPVVLVNQSSGKEMLILTAKAGKLINFDAGGSTDPDGNRLSYEWMVYPDDNHLTGKLEMKTDKGKASVKMPEMKKGESINLLLKVTDDGKPQLTSYKRIILNPK